MKDNSQAKADRPLLSICIPTYNRAAYFLPECLNSLVSQFTDEEICRQVEIVISDNASVDNTEEVVREYRKKFSNIRYFRLDSTITSALNWDNALRHSRGRYINTIGDDDVYLPGSLKKLLPRLATAEARLVAVAHVLIINDQAQLADSYSGQATDVAVANIAKNFFAFSNASDIERMKLGPGFMFFLGDLARDIRNSTGYFWKDPIGDHWAVFSVLQGQPSLVFYDEPVVGCRVHAGNHLAYKYKKDKMAAGLESFLKLHNNNFNLFPGPSFTNLGYAGMQDIQFHFPWYRQLPINTDRGLVLHIDDILHSDFSIKEKIKYSWQSWRLIRRRKFWLGARLFFKGISFVGKFIAAYFKNRPV